MVFKVHRHLPPPLGGGAAELDSKDPHGSAAAVVALWDLRLGPCLPGCAFFWRRGVRENRFPLVVAR